MTNLFGNAERHREVNSVMEGVIARMESLGATVVRFELPEYDTLASVDRHVDRYEARTVMDRYFAALGPNAPVRTFAQLVAAKTSAVQKTLEEEHRRRRRHEQPGLQGPDVEPRQAAARRGDEYGGI